MENVSLMLRIDQRIEELAGLTFMHFGVEVKRPKIVFDLYGLAAGQARIYANEIALNPVLLFENPNEFVQETVGHEFCHFGTKRLHPKAKFNHGRQWQSMMRTLKVPINIDHKYNINTLLGKTPNLVKSLRGERISLRESVSEHQLMQDYRQRVEQG